MSVFRFARGTSILAVSLCLLFAPVSLRVARGQGLEPPFVAGFDRFARHGALDATLGGKLLIAELSCTACHGSTARQLAPSRGPRLDGVGNRLQAPWLREFLADPQKTKPGTKMPDVLSGIEEAERKATVEALVAFLGTRQVPYPEFKASGVQPLAHQFWLKGSVDQGRELYHRVGCVACHAPDSEHEAGNAQPSAVTQMLATLDPEEIEELGLSAAMRPVRSVPHSDLSAKFTHKSLMAFLADPEAVRPNGRMPNLKLSLVEAADIAAYLLSDDPPAAVPENSPADDVAASGGADDALVEKGRRLFVSLSCVNCHPAEGLEPTSNARAIGELDPHSSAGCLQNAVAGRPDFQLDDLQIDTIAAAIDALKEAKEPGGDVDDPRFTLLQQNCFACHERSGLGGVGPERQAFFETVSHTDLGDEGRLPPPLTHVGRKLKQDWLAKVFAGTGDLRPHMQARMPRYPAAVVKHLPQAFARADAPESTSEAEIFPEQEGLVEAGRMLLDTGCVQCHPLRGESLMGTVGLDLQDVTGRVQPEWFREFLRNPAALKNRTRMPSFFPDGQSANQEILGGDVDAQITAIWTYLKNLKTARLPDKLEESRSQQFELTPVDRPILIRSFMKEAGPHAIAVGFPEQVHYAFDAESLRLTQAWRGRFLDAYGTWFVRSAPPADPLGTDGVSLPPGFPFAILSTGEGPWPTMAGDDADARFMGYRFDKEGVPTLLYRYGGYEIEDRVVATTAGGLNRSITVRSSRPQAATGKLWFRAHMGKNLAQKDLSCVEPEGLTVSLSAAADDVVLRPSSGGAEVMEWRVSVPDGQRLEVNYQW